MSSGVASLVAGVLFGLALSAPFGPVNALVAEQSVLRGWIAEFSAGFGSAFGDTIYFVLAYAGAVAFVRDAPTLRAVLVGVGGVCLLYFAYESVRDLRGSVRPDERSRGGSHSFRRGFVIAATNPYQVVFWLTVGIGLLDPGRLDVLGSLPLVGRRFAGTLVVETGSPLLIVGFFLGLGIWVLSFPTILVFAERHVDALEPLVAGGSALVLGGFGLSFVFEAVAGLS